MIIEGEKSTYVPVESGVHQGSVFNLSLFLYYINDIPVGLNCKIKNNKISFNVVGQNGNKKVNIICVQE
jgi:hypothetical protein